MKYNYYEIANSENGLKRAEINGFGGILSAIPNTLGINLSSVKGLFTEEQDDGQLVHIRIDFLPK